MKGNFKRSFKPGFYFTRRRTVFTLIGKLWGMNPAKPKQKQVSEGSYQRGGLFSGWFCYQTVLSICQRPPLRVGLPLLTVCECVITGFVSGDQREAGRELPPDILTLVTATFAPLLISWTTHSAWPLWEAVRRRSESARTSAASCWLMKQEVTIQMWRNEREVDFNAR